jgi:acetylornithine/succinyldiaminopimelate/putrescine aminotransferase
MMEYFTDEDYEKLSIIEEKLADGQELTEEEEQHYLDMVLNGGDNNFGATT